MSKKKKARELLQERVARALKDAEVEALSEALAQDSQFTEAEVAVLCIAWYSRDEEPTFKRPIPEALVATAEEMERQGLVTVNAVQQVMLAPATLLQMEAEVKKIAAEEEQ